MIIKQNTLRHPRTLIREKVKELLLPNLDVGRRIFISRPNEVWLKEVPCALIYFTDEDADTKDSRPRRYWNNLLLNIQILTNYSKDADEWLDSRALEVQFTMETANYLDLDFVQDILYTRTRPTTIDGQGKTDIESLQLFYTIEFLDCLEYATINPDLFKGFDVTYNDLDGNKIAEDQVDME